MEKIAEFHDTTFAVTYNGLKVLIKGVPELVTLMDGCFFDDNCTPETLKKFPDSPGVYQCTIEYWFQQGYFEGYQADGESDWDLRPIDIRAFLLCNQAV